MTIPLVALVGSVMVSYVRAKTEALGLKLPSGVMRRPSGSPTSSWGWSRARRSARGCRRPSARCTRRRWPPSAFVAVTSNYAAVRLAAHGRTALLRSGRGPGGKLP